MAIYKSLKNILYTPTVEYLGCMPDERMFG